MRRAAYISEREQILFLLAFFSRTNDNYKLAMISRRCVLSITVVLTALLAGRAQTSPPHGPAKDDYFQEAAVIEQMAAKIAFDNDGKFNREQTSRVRVQTDSSVKQWGLLSFPFQSATQTVEIDYVRVHKADGTILITPPDNVQDLDSEITRSAHFYSDLREKHVAVKGLGKGDILEYAAHWHTTKPLIPRQLWFQYSFQHEGIVQDERMEIKVPAERSVKVRGPQATQTVATDAGFRVYTWIYSKLQSATEPGSDQKKQTESERGLLPPPDVEISSAEFFVLLASDGKSKAFKVEHVKFISGSDKMKLQGKQLKTIDFDVPAPDNVPTRFVRRGILGCYQYSGCSFALLDPASVQSLN
jgi:Domain of Unknown Function with PDB structure (DUF3857)